MAGDTIITVVGNTTAAPEIRYFPSGASVANFTLASTPRYFDRASGEWQDSEALFLRCNAWGQLGEHIADSVPSGARVVVQGRLKTRSFENQDGEKRTVIELEVDELGPSLKYATATITKAAKRSTPTTTAPSEPTHTPAAVDDPWAVAPESALATAGAGSEPPF